MIGTIEASSTTARLTAALDVVAPHLRPIILAVRDHRVGLLFVSQGSPAFAIPTSAKGAALVMVGDDMKRSMGPSGFHRSSLRRAVRACRAFTVIPGEPAAETYAVGTAPTVGGVNAMIVETRPEHAPEWVALIKNLAPGRPVLLAAPDGGTACTL
jgi:hypothetical protein